MTVVTIEQAQKSLADLIAKMQPGEELLITDGQIPLAELMKLPSVANQMGKAGCYRKAEFRMASDFDDELDDFRDYSE